MEHKSGEKRLLNCSGTDPNKMLPMKYNWARKHYKDGVANNWTPEEVNMQKDVEMWRSPDALSEQERRLVLWNMGFFSTAESLTANNIVLNVYRHVTNPECRQYLLRQAFEEAVHTDTFIYCCDTLGLDPDEVYNMYMEIPSIRDKDEFVIDITKSILDPHFNTEGRENMQRFVHDLVGFYVIMEGIFFYAGFVMMLSFLRQIKMVGVGEHPEIWTEAFKQTLVENIKTAVELEHAYTRDCLPRGVLGLNSDAIYQYVKHIADRRLERINLPKQYNVANPFPWMSEVIDLKKEKNFFETRVTEYKTGGVLSWE